MHNDKPTVKALKSLSDSEELKARLEKELQAIVSESKGSIHTSMAVNWEHLQITSHWLWYFKNYWLAKPLNDNMILKLQGYRLYREYRPEKEMTQVDTLSHLPSNKNKDTIDLDVRIELVRFNDKCLNYTRNETRFSYQSFSWDNNNRMARATISKHFY